MPPLRVFTHDSTFTTDEFVAIRFCDTVPHVYPMSEFELFKFFPCPCALCTGPESQYYTIYYHGHFCLERRRPYKHVGYYTLGAEESTAYLTRFQVKDTTQINLVGSHLEVYLKNGCENRFIAIDIKQFLGPRGYSEANIKVERTTNTFEESLHLHGIAMNVENVLPKVLSSIVAGYAYELSLLMQLDVEAYRNFAPKRQKTWKN